MPSYRSISEEQTTEFPKLPKTDCARAIRSENKGLISTDRGTKTTLVRTIPRSILGRIRRICPFQYLQELLSPTHHHFQVGCGPCNRVILDHFDLKLFFITWEKLHIDTFSRDSGLEAFSRNPTHGSFSALTFQSTDLPIM